MRDIGGTRRGTAGGTGLVARPFGEIFVQLLDELHVHAGNNGKRINRILTYEELYESCSRREKSRYGKAIHFRVDAEPEAMRKQIARLRDPKHAPSNQVVQLLAEAFGVPWEVFDGRMNAEEVAAAYYLAHTPEDVRGKLRNFLDVYERETIPESRLTLAKTVDGQLSQALEQGNVVLLIEGAAMVGKSFFLGHWARDHVANRYSPALLVDCRDLSLDQIVPAITAELGTLSILGAPVPSLPRLIVLDGLRYRNFREGARNGGARLSDLADILKVLLNRGRNLAIVVVMENEGAPISTSTLRASLGPRVTLLQQTLRPLDPMESERLLEVLLADRTLPDPIAKELVRRTSGMPFAIVAEANLVLASSPFQIEAALRRGIRTSGDETSQLSSYFKTYFSSEQDVDDAAEFNPSSGHPLAFMRLLALMPGATTKRELAEIIRSVRIKRLGYLADLDALARGLPFVLRADGAFDLHALAREHFLAELDQFVESEAFDHATSEEELLHIHWKAAAIAWRILSDEETSNRLTVASVWHLVYHLLRMIRLMPDDRRQGRVAEYMNSRKFAEPSISDQKIQEFLSSSSALKDLEAWNFAYTRGVQRFLLDKRKSATRLHGQFEAKARIIETLIPPRGSDLPVHPSTLVGLLLRRRYAGCTAGV